MARCGIGTMLQLKRRKSHGELAIVGMVVFAEDCCDSPSAPFAMVQLGCWDVGGASSR